MLLPISFSIGSLDLSPARAFLLVAFVPLAIRWLSGAAGRVTGGDVFFALHCLWLGAALLAIHGSERIPFAGITVVEVFGSYLAGRILVRNVADYRLVFRYMLIAFAILLPFVVHGDADRAAAPQQPPPRRDLPEGAERRRSMRMGFYRAQAVFEHPILWGVFCSLAIANVFYLHRARFFKGVALAGFATGMTFTSLSSGPLLAATLQIGIVGWGWITRNAWWALVGLAVLGYVVVDLLSNRSPVNVLISYLTFNSASAYWRLHIWNFGIQEVWRHPLLRDRAERLGAAVVDVDRLGRQLLAADDDALRHPGLPAARRRHRPEPRRHHPAGSCRPSRSATCAAATWPRPSAWRWRSARCTPGARCWSWSCSTSAPAPGCSPAGRRPKRRAKRRRPSRPPARRGRAPPGRPGAGATRRRRGTRAGIGAGAGRGGAPSPRRGPSKAERLARRQAQYSRRRP